MKTKTQCLIDALVKVLGCTEVQDVKSRKYRMFQAGPGKFYLVGKAGAVRFNSTPKVQGALACNENWIKKMADIGRDL